ncbi:MAG: glycoside hydrolase family 2, partial [Clostridia bacterium]|nr:glycoside hydrolase family 2 [Clostridia bacterium]
VKSLHVYFRPYRFRKDKHGRAVVLSEFGGYTLALPDHCWNDAAFGYRNHKSKEHLAAAITKLYEEQIIPAVSKGLCATVYTQVSDVEEEINGFLTYDRQIIKVPVAFMRRINDRLLEEANR